MPIISETLDRYVKKIDKSWTHDRSNTVGASEVGQCARKIFWLKSEADAKHRVARDPDFQETWGARIRGTIIEDKFWEPALRDRFDKRLLFAGKAFGDVLRLPQMAFDLGPHGLEQFSHLRRRDRRQEISVHGIE